MEKITSSYIGLAGLFNKNSAPKVNKFERGYVYVLRLSNDYTKIGCSADPYTRLSCLKRGLRSTDVELGELWISCSHINFKDNEKLILAMLDSKKKDGEFFQVPFNEAVEFVENLEVKTKFTLEELQAKEESRMSFVTALDDLHELSRKNK
ncbi:TPA: GIY-YIG nuclease family protein [Yersinia enterocolitica]|uniref:GIY-YIG nuclease family protein n=1 Tax=Yersinia enterocolitica TaxID=630 RepID=UPI00227BE2D5|nr:GIY-YIG nuclease family protein [Yersinia enterocolitica]EKN5913165.1 GIY-YIG nuclease family protein [Yersinia enterocolitica]MCY1687434.1 GIY-YIG nuclease family protein [Yersinia enterocolitica]HDM8081150.1 GIY-YIG nuclease family protein [Yersinia enterocolitica]HDW8043849.1 GIY-YIG nuclease family protein [Yersinia enterocolitica]HEM6608295.1 GIY-YIG nuclease family protein [Yersinia enterocolitica]